MNWIWVSRQRQLFVNAPRPFLRKDAHTVLEDIHRLLPSFHSDVCFAVCGERR
jgi:hypothetical protein